MTSCISTLHQNNTNPLICTVFGIRFLPVPAWHCATIFGVMRLRNELCTLLPGTAPWRNGLHLGNPEIMCTLKYVRQTCRLFKTILLFFFLLFFFALLHVCVSPSFIVASCFSSFITHVCMSSAPKGLRNRSRLDIRKRKDGNVQSEKGKQSGWMMQLYLIWSKCVCVCVFSRYCKKGAWFLYWKHCVVSQMSGR